MSTLRAEIKTQWLEALRSGEYVQGRYMLNNPAGEYCCLGVLCELAYAEGVVEKKTRDDGKHQYNDDITVLPGAVMAWSGLNDYNPRVSTLGGTLSLAELNDYRGKTFLEIADIIEEEL